LKHLDTDGDGFVSSNEMLQDLGETVSSPDAATPTRFAMFAVEPKLNCPHFSLDNSLLSPERWCLQPASSPTPARPYEPLVLNAEAPPCAACGECDENWVCLGCLQIGCSRYRHGHALEHFQASGHSLAVSLSDLSVMCYACDKYVKHELAKPALRAIYYSKFGEVLPESQGEQLDRDDEEPTPSTLGAALERLPSSTAPADMTDPCTICLEQLGGATIVELTCGHDFHRTCLATWVLRQNECPVCRERVLEDWARNVIVSSPTQPAGPAPPERQG